MASPAPTPTRATPAQIPRAFTARQFASRTGRTAKAIAQLLRDVEPAESIIVPHVVSQVPVYIIASLPPVLREELAVRSQGYRTIEEYMIDTGSLWQPDVPLKECCDANLDYAARLQKALLPFLADAEQVDGSVAECDARGAVAHAQAFRRVRPLGARQWRRLYDMVQARLRGGHDFERLEIYLPPKQTRRETPGSVVSEALEDCFDLAVVIRGCTDPMNPTSGEWEVINRRVREQYEALCLEGTKKQAMRRLGDRLASMPPFVRKSRNAIRCQLSGWVQKWAKHGTSPEAHSDHRASNTGNHDNYEFPVADWEMLIGTSVWRHDGDVAAGWRELWHTAQFSPSTMKHFGKWTRSRKSDVPKAVMRAVRSEVKILRRWRLGARGYNSMRATINVSDVPLPPMLVISADDLTPDCYYGIEVAPGKDRMVRGQILLFIDVGTMRILGYVIAPDANYNALMILGAMTRIFRDIGVPAGVHYERGIWERADLVKGRSKGIRGMSQTEREGRFERLGIKFSHAVSPQGKSRMERTIKAMQELFRAEPGWCGNDEKNTCPEETRRLIDRVNKGELRAREAGFHDYESFETRFRELCQRYNATAQEGKILKRLSPDAAFEQFQNPDYLPTKFTPELEHLLTEHVEEVKVTINGLRLPFGKGVYYTCPPGYVGKTVKVSLNVLDWSKHGLPDEVTVSDLSEKHYFAASRKTEVNPAMWILEPECDDLRKAKRENANFEAPFKALLKKLNPRFCTLAPEKPLPTRRTVANQDTHRKGENLKQARAKEADRRHTMASQLGAVLGEMDSDEEGRHIEHGVNLENARRRQKEQAKADREFKPQVPTMAELDAQEAALKHLFV